MITSNIAGTTTAYTYDTLGSLVLEKSKNHVVDYQYNELNQLVQKKDGNESYTYTYDKRGNRTAEIGKKASRSYVYDETNRMVEGTNWKGDKSAYTYNGLGLRINNTQTTHAGKVYARDYVIDHTSFENDDLMVYAEGNGQLEYEQKHVYAGSERIEQFTDKGNWERTLYVHEDVMGNTRYYTKANGQSFAELTYDAWGMPESPNKLLNNDHGNYVFATFTGHIYDTTLDIYFAEARFYDVNNRTWLAMDPIKDGLNWYQYCYSNPTTYFDPLGLWGTTTGSKQSKLTGSGQVSGSLVEFIKNKVFEISGTEITDDEAILITMDPGQAVHVFLAGRQAERWTNKVFGIYYQDIGDALPPHWQDGDAANAYRHAMWNALLTQNIGATNAKGWTDAHEAWPVDVMARDNGGGFTRAEHTAMDFHNNAVGREVVKWLEPVSEE